ncbi:LOW QUALITY PROTEIN: GATOR complex protein MIOS [Drosophila eugracilis]|uniref:LOW QUALITY PROTEIN: GATOR complex protein MIOS n=1 Tax=Drosophila eugracilis TaxID=29029 RepID=UPI001BDB3E63|nr:LOW QUALITY PROTEIN: GATOR complex protein MIOS [Drosophila eugracilis]
MSGNTHGLSWFPHFPDKFVSWGQEIHLYEVRRKDDHSQKSRLPYISVNYLANESHYQYARCVAASYHSDQPIIAVGLADGKIGICNFRDTYDSSWEYTPRQQRMCTCLAWNELDANILAIGHDRHRNDTCITIWDIERGVPKETANFFGVGESANSICWDRNHRTVIAGMSQKMIKLFDLRQSNATCQSIQTKTVQGLSVSPNGNYLCSYVDSVITLWDPRNIKSPLRQIQSSKNHLQIAWCPTRTSLLSSLQRDSSYITLYDIRSVDSENSGEIYHVKRQISPFPARYQHSGKFSFVNCLSWHSRDFERALLLADALNILDFRLPATLHTAHSNRRKLPLLMQRPLCTPSSPTSTTAVTPTKQQPTSSCSTNSGSSLDFTSPGGSPLNVDLLEPELFELDLVDEMRQRALEDYGIKPDNKRFAELHLTPYLRNVWSTLNNVYCDDRLTGLKATLGINLGHTSEALMASSRIESQVLQWPEGINNSNKLICYRSEQRDLALQLCGWAFEHELERFIDQLYANKEYSRAAMICVFHLKIFHACNILSSAADNMRDPSMYRITVIALSSFNADRCSSTWRNQRSSANMQIHDPHLRAVFSFLTMEKDNFDAVLKEDGVSLSDRMAFACKYLSETKLADYVTQQIQTAIDGGDLNGLMLTGESLDGINILQSYMDTSFDVQTVALVAINYFRQEHFADKRIQYWIASYLDHLNSWGLWEKRAELDIKIEGIRTSSRSSRTVFLSCNFCGKSVSNALLDEPRPRSTTTSTNRLSSCPSCRKPLPRCSLCLMHMGTMVNMSNGETPNSASEVSGWQTKPFSKWFSWCQTCRHGGHTEHIMQWFKQNSECPVSSCNCRCFDMDGTKPNTLRDIS